MVRVHWLCWWDGLCCSWKGQCWWRLLKSDFSRWGSEWRRGEEQSRGRAWHVKIHEKGMTAGEAWRWGLVGLQPEWVGPPWVEERTPGRVLRLGSICIWGEKLKGSPQCFHFSTVWSHLTMEVILVGGGFWDSKMEDAPVTGLVNFALALFEVREYDLELYPFLKLLHFLQG